MCKKRCPHIEQPPNARVGIPHSGEVYPVNSRRGMQTNDLSLLNNTAAIKLALFHLLSHSPCNQIGEIIGWHYMTRRWLSGRANPRAINQFGETALWLLMNFSHATTNAGYSSFCLQAKIWRHLLGIYLKLCSSGRRAQAFSWTWMRCEAVS